jgi:hypothetical protein
MVEEAKKARLCGKTAPYRPRAGEWGESRRSEPTIHMRRNGPGGLLAVMSFETAQPIGPDSDRARRKPVDFKVARNGRSSAM